MRAIGWPHSTPGIEPGDDGHALSASDSADVIVRVRGDQDDAIPSATSQIIDAVTRLAVATGDDSLLQRAQTIAESALGRVLQQQYGPSGVLNSSSLLLEPMKLVLVTPDPKHELMETADRHPDPNAGLTSRIEFRQNEQIELVPGGGGVTIKKPAAFLCRGLVCFAPVETATELEILLRRAP